MQTIQVPTIQIVCCPNCGSAAERYRDSSRGLSGRATNQQAIRTQCQHCDYLMVTCAQTGKVIEAYAPGIPFEAVSLPIAIETLATAHKPHSLPNL